MLETCSLHWPSVMKWKNRISSVRPRRSLMLDEPNDDQMHHGAVNSALRYTAPSMRTDFRRSDRASMVALRGGRVAGPSMLATQAACRAMPLPQCHPPDRHGG